MAVAVTTSDSVTPTEAWATPVVAEGTPLDTTFKEFSSSQLEEFKETFSLFEIEKGGKKSGRIKAEDLPIVMRALGQYASDDEFRRMTAGKKNFNFQEFLDLMEAQAKETAKVLTYNNLEKEFIEAFKIFDRDGNGYVDAGELRHMMQNHGSMRLTDAEVEEMMSDADINGDGKLNFQEFIQLMMAPVDDAAAFNSSHFGNMEVIDLMGSKSSGPETTSQVLDVVGEFDVTIERPADTELGLQVDFTNKELLNVEDVITTGPVHKSNFCNSNPKRKVLKQDQIIAVNGVTGNAKDMIRELQKKTPQVQFKIRRGMNNETGETSTGRPKSTKV